MGRSRNGRLGLVLAVSCGVVACVEPRGSTSAAVAAEPPGCRATILVTLDHEPGTGEWERLGAASATQLTVTSRLTPTLYVLALTAIDSDCSAALARLRAGEGVRSAELDTRRGLDDPPNG
jgi:hypothetical protein